MDRIIEQPDGSYFWVCPIEKEYHRKSAVKGLWACLFLVAFVLILWAFLSAKYDNGDMFWVPILVISVILVIALPILYFQYTAEDPHEQYVMNGDHVKTGYGKGAVFSVYKKTKGLILTSKYIEFIGKYGSSRVYVPEKDMDFVRKYVTERMPENAEIRRL